MRVIRNRSSNWLRREIVRGINDYLDEREGAADGRQRTIFIGPGGYRSRAEMSFPVRKLPPAAVEPPPAAAAFQHWP